MEVSRIDINEQQAAAAFDVQSGSFDNQFSTNSIIRYKRERVREVLQKHLGASSHILELNSGTGEDAVWLARQGYQVHATDISSGMLRILREKTASLGLEDSISSELCSFTQLESMKEDRKYDAIFSNFAGLNCTGDLEKVLQSFDKLLKPRGTVVLVMLPSFCLWETLLLFRGKFRTAFRRWSGRSGVVSRVEGMPFKCFYYNPAWVIRTLKSSFDLVKLEGLCTIVPPSYIEYFAEKHPSAYLFLKKKEDRLKSKWPWKFIGDYYILVLRKKA